MHVVQNLRGYFMHRLLETRLIAWKNQKNRLPLLLRGARQVGKSYLVEAFGRSHFGNLISVNFERRPQLKQIFETPEPKRICEALSLRFEQALTPGQTLVFLDEIQECPQAIQALRYFKEEMP